MKKQLLFLLILGIFSTVPSFAQIGGSLDNITKQGNANLNNAASDVTLKALNTLEDKLKNQFSLDAIKAEIAGDVLKLKIADTDLAKSPAVARTKQATQIALAAREILMNSGLDIKKMNVTNVVVTILKNISLKEIIDTIKVKI